MLRRWGFRDPVRAKIIKNQLTGENARHFVALLLLQSVVYCKYRTSMQDIFFKLPAQHRIHAFCICSPFLFAPLLGEMWLTFTLSYRVYGKFSTAISGFAICEATAFCGKRSQHRATVLLRGETNSRLPTPHTFSRCGIDSWWH